MEATRCSMLLRTSVHVELLSFTLCLQFLCAAKTNHYVSTTQHTNTHVLFCVPLQILFHVDGHALRNAHCCANPHITSPTSVWKVSDLCVWGLLSVQAVPYSREFKQKYDYFRKKLKKPVRPKFQFFAIELHVPQLPLVNMDFVCSRLTFPTDLKWSYTGTTSLKSLTGASCPWRGLTSWRLGCGLSLSLRKDLTMAAWPESGSSSYLKRCSILIMAYLNTLPRKLLLICVLAWDLETS